METRALLGNQPTGKKREREKARRRRRPARALPGMMGPLGPHRVALGPRYDRVDAAEAGKPATHSFGRPGRVAPAVVNPAISKPKKTKSEVPCGAASVAGGNSAESRVAGARGEDASPRHLQRGVRATRAAYRGFGYRRARVPAVTSPECTALNLGGFSPPRTQFGAVLVVEPSPFSAASAGLVPVCVPTPITRGCAGVVARRREVQTRSRAALRARVSGCLTCRFAKAHREFKFMRPAGRHFRGCFLTLNHKLTERIKLTTCTSYNAENG